MIEKNELFIDENELFIDENELFFDNLLFFDLETSEATYKSHSDPGRPIYLQHDDIIEEKQIICAAWHWAGSKDVHCISWDMNAEVDRDRLLVEEFSKEIMKADAVVGHFVNGFDLPWMRRRCLDYNLDPIPKVSVIDTVKLCKPFKFASNKLDYVAQRFGVGKKNPMSKSDWRAVENGDEEALRKMMKYCMNDVHPMLYGVYKKLIRYYPEHKITNSDAKLGKCRVCGIGNIVKNGFNISPLGHRHRRYRCGNIYCRATHTNTSRDKKNG